MSKDIAQDIAELSAEQRELLELLMREESIAPSRLPITPTGADRRSLPLSFAQQRLWFFDRLNPGSPAYNVSAGVRMRGALNVAALGQCFGEVVRRHEVLRATFTTGEGEPAQVVGETPPPAPSFVDLSGLPAAGREAEARRLAGEEARRPFDLTRGPLLRVAIVRLGPGEHVLLVTMHHIVSDAWSLGLLVDEVVALYPAYAAGAPSPLADLPVQYHDYAAWQRSWLQGEELDTQLDYWKRQLAGAPPVLGLPTDRPRPAVQRFRGAAQSFVLPEELKEGLKQLSRRQGGTLFQTMVAALQTLLHLYTGQEDISLGAPVANRARVELEGLIGFFINTLVLRTDFAGDPTFVELLGRVRETVVGAQAHQEVPFEKLVEVLQPDRDLSHTPLFQVALSLDNTPANDLTLPALSFSPFEIGARTSRLDLHLTIVETPKGLHGSLEYNTDLFDAETVGRMIGHFEALLAGVVADPGRKISELSLLTEEERRRLLVDWNETRREFPDGPPAHELFEAQAARTPDAVALLSEEGHLSYGELNRRANRLAHYLRKLGVGPEVRVAVCMRRSAEMVVAVLGVLKAGGAYVPVDPTYPSERISFMLEDAGVPLVLTAGNLLEDLMTFFAQKVYLDAEWETIASESGENPAPQSTGENLAYVIYTSGSTGGVPKAVLLHHRGLCNLTAAQARAFDVRPESRVLQFASTSFDASVSEIFVTLTAGATLVLPTEESLLPGPEFIARLREQAVTSVTLPPSVLSVLPPEEAPTLEVVVAAGEECTAEVAARWSRGRRFLNAYGPTETTVCATVGECRGDGRRPDIGRPIDNTRLLILNKYMRPVPVGVPGEVHVAGVGLARGYQGRPELTAQSFIPDSFGEESGARLYKTGDRARHLPGGKVDFLGRVDRQIKLRGYRIELGEIEAVLGGHRAVREAVVLAREDRPGDRRLVAYVVAREGETFEVAELYRFLQRSLPEFMLPSEFVTLDALPLTPSGKVDRRALPAPEQTGARADEVSGAPRTPLEKQLSQIWAEVLGVERVGIHDDFFELRGHSLSLIQVAFRVQETLGCELPLQIFFLAPTIAELAKEIESANQEG